MYVCASSKYCRRHVRSRLIGLLLRGSLPSIDTTSTGTLLCLPRTFDESSQGASTMLYKIIEFSTNVVEIVSRKITIDVNTFLLSFYRRIDSPIIENCIAFNIATLAGTTLEAKQQNELLSITLRRQRTNWSPIYTLTLPIIA